MSEQIIKVMDLKKRFDKDGVEINVLKGINLVVNKGDFITIMGPSGAGKSTFLHIVGALDRPTEGEVLFRDRNVQTFTEDEESRFRNEKVGFIFQFYHLLQDFNVFENIMMPLLIKGMGNGEAIKKAEDFLEIVGLAGRKNHKPGELSGGEQQRVAIARALINDPDLILADEPTGALDSRTGNEIMELFGMLNEDGKTVIVVTHDPKLASFGKRLIRIEDGTISEDITA